LEAHFSSEYVKLIECNPDLVLIQSLAINFRKLWQILKKTKNVCILLYTAWTGISECEIACSSCGEGEREGEREGEGERDREGKGEREGEGERDRVGEGKRDREREGEREGDEEGEREA
jgi:hypothetical protein